ncbi:cation transporter [Thioclava sp. F42-5]|uniref:cation diffusion facilitator family transporter n=1 Tax=Thioclava sp. F42-5 TaxID=1973005 RepID=UPI000B5458CE|nr:cation diffusion facilitator family transporter [Thioclava sp. F42-5]OWY08773.1 cation transporter [Thioclava sp. F42-5]
MAHDHSHSHDHGHGGPGHSHAPATFGKAFAIGIALNTLYVCLEAAFGLISGSLALLADAGHNLSDVFGLAIAWFATWLERKPPSGRKTYGYKRAPILASLANAVILLVAVGAIVWEAVRRLLDPQPVGSDTILWVAVVGLIVNTGTALLFMRGRNSDLNIKGAFLHMAADAAVTAGVIVAALLIMWFGWQWLDPVFSLVIAAVILVGTWGLLRDSVKLAMDTVPPGIDLKDVRARLENLPGVASLHDLHVWALSTTDTALTCHLVMPEGRPDDAFLLNAADELHEHHGIGHATLQVETDPAKACRLAPEDVV